MRIPSILEYLNQRNKNRLVEKLEEWTGEFPGTIELDKSEIESSVSADLAEFASAAQSFVTIVDSISFFAPFTTEDLDSVGKDEWEIHLNSPYVKNSNTAFVIYPDFDDVGESVVHEIGIEGTNIQGLDVQKFKLKNFLNMFHSERNKYPFEQHLLAYKPEIALFDDAQTEELYELVKLIKNNLRNDYQEFTVNCLDKINFDAVLDGDEEAIAYAEKAMNFCLLCYIPKNESTGYIGRNTNFGKKFFGMFVWFVSNNISHFEIDIQDYGQKIKIQPGPDKSFAKGRVEMDFAEFKRVQEFFSKINIDLEINLKGAAEYWIYNDNDFNFKKVDCKDISFINCTITSFADAKVGYYNISNCVINSFENFKNGNRCYISFEKCILKEGFNYSGGVKLSGSLNSPGGNFQFTNCVFEKLAFPSKMPEIGFVLSKCNVPLSALPRKMYHLGYFNEDVDNLNGCPPQINRLHIGKLKLKNFEGMPSKIAGDFWIHNVTADSLDGFPAEVGGPVILGKFPYSANDVKQVCNAGEIIVNEMATPAVHSPSIKLDF